MSLFVLSSKDGWVTIMYQGLDAVGLDQQVLLSSLKVEKILKGGLDSIPSLSMKIQIICGKVCLRCKGKTLLGDVNFVFSKVC